MVSNVFFFWNQLENVNLFFQLFGGFSFASIPAAWLTCVLHQGCTTYTTDYKKFQVPQTRPFVSSSDSFMRTCVFPMGEINQLQWQCLERDTELVSCESWRHDIVATTGTRVCRHSPFWGGRFKMPPIFARPIRNGGSNLHSEPKPFEGSQNVKISTIYRSWQSCETMSESCVACIFLSTMIGFCHMQTHHSWEESTFSSQRWSGQGLQVFLLVCG